MPDDYDEHVIELRSRSLLDEFEPYITSKCLECGKEVKVRKDWKYEKDVTTGVPAYTRNESDNDVFTGYVCFNCAVIGKGMVIGGYGVLEFYYT